LIDCGKRRAEKKAGADFEPAPATASFYKDEQGW